MCRQDSRLGSARLRCHLGCPSPHRASVSPDKLIQTTLSRLSCNMTHQRRWGGPWSLSWAGPPSSHPGPQLSQYQLPAWVWAWLLSPGAAPKTLNGGELLV